MCQVKPWYLSFPCFAWERASGRSARASAERSGARRKASKRYIKRGTEKLCRAATALVDMLNLDSLDSFIYNEIMPQTAEYPVTFCSLYESPLISVRDYTCGARRHGPGGEEHSDTNTIVLMRRGAFCKHFGRRCVTADVNQVVFFSKGSTYCVSHPADGGDRGTTIEVSPRVLNDIVRELDPSVDKHPDQPFAFVTGPYDLSIFHRHRELVRRLEAASSDPLEPLWADVTSLQLVADVLTSAYARQGRPHRRRRTATSTDHADRVEAAKSYFASRLGERLSLHEVARVVHTSPFHFARIFQERTGVPVHRYLTHLRLRAALERLAGGASDLTGLALELGFSSHSHFADTFRREFGCTPSDIRRGTVQARILEMSKNLEV
jgi:AraC-like DNA-binding protein